MNERIIKLGLDSGMLNYVDNETPRHYFLCGNADEKDLEKFAELLLNEFIDALEYSNCIRGETSDYGLSILINDIKERFGVEE